MAQGQNLVKIQLEVLTQQLMKSMGSRRQQPTKPKQLFFPRYECCKPAKGSQFAHHKPLLEEFVPREEWIQSKAAAS
jgi:hypothetical protein